MIRRFACIVWFILFATPVAAAGLMKTGAVFHPTSVALGVVMLQTHRCTCIVTRCAPGSTGRTSSQATSHHPHHATDERQHASPISERTCSLTPRRLQRRFTNKNSP